ncbi:MAG: hypothetical protein WC756_02485 [Taibaiella sp.]|jgi:hypothetical protein
MKKVIYSLGLVILTTAMFTVTSCTKDPVPDPVVEQEEFDHALIQFVKLNADGSQTTDTTSVNFDKSGTPTPTQVTLANGTSYRTLITLSLKGISINNEIIEEGTEHKFFLNPTQSGILNYTYSDADANGRGIGLDGKLSVIGTGTIDLKVILRHALDKSNADAQTWNSTTYENAGGEDDLNITFGLKAQ